MTEPVESTVSGTGQEAGLPKPEFSENQPASSTSSFPPEALAEISKQLASQIEDAVERKLKSTKDKRFAALEKERTSLTELLTSLKEQGATIPPEVERDYAQRDYLEQRLAQEREAFPTKDAGPSKVGTSAEGQFDHLAVIKELKLDTNSAEVRNLLSGHYRNPDHFKVEAQALALQQFIKPAASPSASAPIAGTPSAPKDESALLAELQQLQKTPLKDPKRMTEIEKALGWR
jgi:hypothetical protein